MKEKLYKFRENKCNEEQYGVLISAESTGVNPQVIDLILQAKKDDTLIFKANQMEVIIKGDKLGFDIDEISKYANPIFSASRMEYILSVLEHPEDFKNNCLDMLTMMHNSNPTYDLDHVVAIMDGSSLMDECVDLFTTLDETGSPIFPGWQAKEICTFLKSATVNQYKQIKDCVDEGLDYDQFSAFMKPEISAEKMRVYRALMKMGCDKDDVGMFEQIGCTYEQLKDIKFAMQYDSYFNFGGGISQIGMSLNNENLAKAIANKLVNKSGIDEDCKEVLINCLMGKMSPYQIELLIDTEYLFDKEEMETVADSLLRGLTVDEVKRVIDESKSNRVMLPEMLKEAVESKFSDSITDEEPER